MYVLILFVADFTVGQIMGIIPAREGRGRCRVPIVCDTITERVENFHLSLGLPNNSPARIGIPNEATGRILDKPCKCSNIIACRSKASLL